VAVIEKRGGKIFRGRVVVMSGVGGLVIAGGVAAMMLFMFEVDIAKWETWAGVAGVFTGSTIVLWILQSLAMKPVRDLAKFIEGVESKNVTKIKIPKTRLFNYEMEGLEDLMKYIKELKCEKVELEKQVSEIQKEGEFLMGALDAMNVGLVILDEDLKIIYNNKMAPVWEDLDGNKKLAMKFWEGDTAEKWLAEVKHDAVKAERIWRRVENKQDTGEERRYFDMVASYNSGGRGEGVLVMVDQTELYSQDDDGLNFMAFAAHELRGPITVIRGYLDVLHDELGDILTKEHQELLSRLMMSANSLAIYLNNILNSAKFENEALKLILDEEKLVDVFTLIEDDAQMRANANGRLLRFDIPKDLPTIAADKSSLGEVFMNLIDNAIKYSYENGIVMVVAQAKGDMVEVSVIDQGLGIPSGLLPNIFRKFYRSHRSRASVAGIGIGLFICRAIVESHGGEIKVESAEEKGTTFTVSLPVYASVASKLQSSGGDNSSMIDRTLRRNLIRNHGTIKG